MKQLQIEAFDFFEKLLDKSCKIVKQECDSPDYINLTGQKNMSGRKRGNTFASLTPYYLKLMLLVCTQDASEKMKRYMTTTVRLAVIVNIVQQFS